jgi:hypothetical protein
MKATLADVVRGSSPTIPPAKDEGDNGHLEYKVYDAVLTSAASSPVDPEMEKFLPLLEEYLTCTSHPFHYGKKKITSRYLQF